MAQTLTEIKSMLAEAGLRPRKRFGQNFLHDGNQMRRIIETAELTPGDRVLEVGAGTGALTERLLDAGAQVVAVEIDRDLEPILRQRLEPYGQRATLYVGDVLSGKHALNPEVVELLSHPSPRPFKLIANLPYNVASPLLVNLVADHPRMTLAVVMVQREVAQRLAAKPGGKDYGPLTVMVQAMCRVDMIATLPPSCFWPQPQVESAVVRLVRRDRAITTDPHRLGVLLQRLFSRRRKQLGTILGRQAPLPPGVAPTDRPETLSVEQLASMAEQRV